MNQHQFPHRKATPDATPKLGDAGNDVERHGFCAKTKCYKKIPPHCGKSAKMTNVLHEKEKHPFGFQMAFLWEIATSGNAREIGVTPALFTHLTGSGSIYPLMPNLTQIAPIHPKAANFAKNATVWGQTMCNRRAKGPFSWPFWLACPPAHCQQSPIRHGGCMSFLFERTSVAGR